MIKLRAYSDKKDLAQAVSEFLAEHGAVAVKNANSLLAGEGNKFAPNAIALAQSFSQLTQLIDITMNDQASHLAHSLLAKVMVGSWLTGGMATVAPEVRSEFDKLKAGRMREARGAKGQPKKDALKEAVAAEIGSRVVSRLKKEAGAILDAVNARLKAGGHAAVSQDTVYRHLQKEQTQRLL